MENITIMIREHKLVLDVVIATLVEGWSQTAITIIEYRLTSEVGSR